MKTQEVIQQILDFNEQYDLDDRKLTYTIDDGNNFFISLGYKDTREIIEATIVKMSTSKEKIHTMINIKHDVLPLELKIKLCELILRYTHTPIEMRGQLSE